MAEFGVDIHTRGEKPCRCITLTVEAIAKSDAKAGKRESQQQIESYAKNSWMGNLGMRWVDKMGVT